MLPCADAALGVCVGSGAACSSRLLMHGTVIPVQQGALSQPGLTGSQPVPVSPKCLISMLFEMFSVLSLGMCFL